MGERTAGKVISMATMSLDGYISGPGESGFDRLFAWYDGGEVEVDTARPGMTWRMSPQSARLLLSDLASVGAMVVGRRLFDLTGGWDGRHPFERPIVVVSHGVPDGWPRPGVPYEFCRDGVGAAVERARALARGRHVGVTAGSIARQCLEAGLLDEVWISLAPVLLGGGTPYFDGLAVAPADLEGPYLVVQDPHVTHLRYRVRR
ncbi:dihydrofolate reductase family protein [Actinomadura parmotrematis]|uniref:Dihydrofolate reductase family protein n=1 Tax=Actinomadura parmotrematis TaxID=2864039 RepID=A0ABS7FRR6_9ACTN|nr:dihydrofolate reductase family protein [Actinomadura parmotrematis]MBW8483092.1 dihydrofolate reductase family protein [Actinomadura parmotrematis]